MGRSFMGGRGGGLQPSIMAYMGIMLFQEERLYTHPLFALARSDTTRVVDRHGATTRLNTSERDDPEAAAAPQVQFSEIRAFAGQGRSLGEVPSTAPYQNLGMPADSRAAWLKRMEDDQAQRNKTSKFTPLVCGICCQDYDSYARVVAEEKVHAHVESCRGQSAAQIGNDAPKKQEWTSSKLLATKVPLPGASLVMRLPTRTGFQPIPSPIDFIICFDFQVGAWVLLAKATSTLRVPVVAAGASGTGRQLAAALAMGAQGVTMATRFLCTVEDGRFECMARPEVDERQTTIVLGTLSNATRVFKNGVAEEIRRIERQGDVDFSQVMPLASGGRTKKMWQETGDTQDAMWSCSQSLGVISDIPTCKELLRRMVAEAEERLNHGAKCIINSKL
eukprot:g18930.t1